MKILSNSEFEILAEKQSNVLKSMAKSRARNDPQGFLTDDDVTTYMTACMHAGDHSSVNWLKNLRYIAKSGLLTRLRKGGSLWENHVIQVNAMHRNGEVKFKIGDAVMVKESGKQGQVVDYLPEEKEFIVVLDPFQVKSLKPGDLEKVAKKYTK